MDLVQVCYTEICRSLNMMDRVSNLLISVCGKIAVYNTFAYNTALHLSRYTAHLSVRADDLGLHEH